MNNEDKSIQDFVENLGDHIEKLDSDIMLLSIKETLENIEERDFKEGDKIIVVSIEEPDVRFDVFISVTKRVISLTSILPVKIHNSLALCKHVNRFNMRNKDNIHFMAYDADTERVRIISNYYLKESESYDDEVFVHYLDETIDSTKSEIEKIRAFLRGTEEEHETEEADIHRPAKPWFMFGMDKNEETDSETDSQQRKNNKNTLFMFAKRENKEGKA